MKITIIQKSVSLATYCKDNVLQYRIIFNIFLSAEQTKILSLNRTDFELSEQFELSERLNHLLC